MGISFLEGLGYVAQGAVEKDEQIRQEKLQARMEEMKENRAFYREQAKTRYAVDLAEYQEESKKVKGIQAALANIKSANGGKGMGKYDAALTLIKADEKEMAFFNSLPDAQKTAYVMQKTNTFEDITNDAGEVTGFKVNYALPTLTSPQEADYRKGPEFWNDYAEEIRQGTDGPLSKQVKKLLGREADASNVVKEDLNVKGTQVVGDFGTEEVISNNTSTSDLLTTSTGAFAYSWTDKTDPEYIEFNTVIDNYKNIRTDKNKANVVAAPILALDKESLKGLTTTEDGTVMADGDAAFLFGQTADLYNASNTFLKDSIVYADSSVPFLKKNTRAGNVENHSKIFKSQWNARTITLDNDRMAYFGGTIDGKYVIGTDILPLMVDENLNPIFYSDEVKSIIEQKVNEYIYDKEGSISQHEKGINQVIKNTIAELEEQAKANKSVYTDDGIETNIQKDNVSTTETTQAEPALETFIVDFAKENNLNIQDAITELKTNNVNISPSIENKLLNTTYTQSLAPQNVPPRPTGDGRPQVEARNEWDKLYGDTHNPDGTPILESNQAPVEIGTVPPRPTGQSGKAWDKKYKDTHNPDGTPKQ